MDPIGELVAYEQAALAAIAAAGDASALEAVRIEYLGRKHGRLRELQTLLGQVDPAQRPVVGKQFNEAKSKVETAFEARKQLLARPNWLAGPSYLATFGILYALRVEAEERMMLERFGEAYASYTARTNRLIPGPW